MGSGPPCYGEGKRYWAEEWAARHQIDMKDAVAYADNWSDRSLLERELRAWSGRDPKGVIEFDQSQAFAMEKAATLTHTVRMLCDDLRGDTTSLDHPFLRDRMASALTSALLIGLPHNHSRAFEVAEPSIAPASVRRAERYIAENAGKAIGLSDVASARGRCKWPFAVFATRRRWHIGGPCDWNC